MHNMQGRYLSAAILSLTPILLALAVLLYVWIKADNASTPTGVVAATSFHTQPTPDVAAAAAGMTLYIDNCMVCHGTSGMGSDVFPALNNPAIRDGDRDYLINTVTLGHEGTAMVGFGMEVTGRLTNEQIAQVITFLQHGSWEQLIATVPPTPTQAPTEVTVASAPTPRPRPGQQTRVYDPAVLEIGVDVYMEICLACHGADMRGNSDVADLTARETQRKSDEALLEIIRLGVDGTEMTGYRAMLTPEQIDAVLALIRSPEVLAP